jgi:hypothetical protein
MITNPNLRMMGNRSAVAMISCMIFAFCSVTVNAQEGDDEKPSSKEKNDRFMVVLTIGEQEAAALRRDGQLRATLPAKFQNRVDSVLLKHPTTFLSKKLLIKDDIDKLGRTLLVNVDESIVDRLEYQPVQMKVYQSGFQSITLKYLRPGNRSRLASIRRRAKPMPNDSPQVFVRLSPQNGTTGWVRNMKSLKFETQFGPTEIPLSRIAGIRFNADESDDVVVISATGDYLTGKIDLSEIELATRWGDEKIPVSKLESITYHRGSRFLEGDPKAGKKWVLTRPVQPLPPSRPPVRFPGNPIDQGLPNSSFQENWTPN